MTKDRKRKKEKFGSEQEAKDRALMVRKTLERTKTLAANVTPQFIRDAVHYDEIFQFYGYSGLVEACADFEKRLNQEVRSPKLRALLDVYLHDYPKDSTRKKWEWLETKFPAGFFDASTGTMDVDFWRDELAAAERRNAWAPATFNEALTMLRSLFRHSVSLGKITRNPLEAIRQRAIAARKVAILEPGQLRGLLTRCVNEAPEMALYFAVLCFGGLRPVAEFESSNGVLWEDVLWSQGLLRVRDTKNQEKTGAVNRYVPLNPTLRSWLEAFRFAENPVTELMQDSECRAFITGNPSPTIWNELSKGKRSRLRKASGLEKKAPLKDVHAALNALRQQGERIERTGRICPLNFRRKRRAILVRPDGSLIAEWSEENRDISRHSYGSYLAAVATADQVREAMGHTDFTTFQRHYRNARTPEQAAEYWGLTFLALGNSGVDVR